MLYPKNKKKLEKALFVNPTSEYRAAPFWAWNCKLEKEQILRQIEQMKEMGMGGYHIHARNGLATEYMGDEFMKLVSACNEKGKQEDMLTWLYDEDRYPSGSAGGKVTKNRDYSARYILFTPYAYGEAHKDKDLTIMWSNPRQENGVYLASYDVFLDDNGCLTSYRKLVDGEKPKGQAWHAYLETAPESPWYNTQTYLDLMNREGVDKFIEETHEKYYKLLGNDFGKSVPAIFTDEPQMMGSGMLEFSNDLKDVTVPCTPDFGETFQKDFGYDYLDKLPELFWEKKDGYSSQFRYQYHLHTSDRFDNAFFKTIGEWCEKHNIIFTGHLMSEQSLLGQYLRLGEAMRLYKHFQLPGIDMLADAHEFTTAKQAQSVVRQNGKAGMLCELDGVTNWDFDFRGHKLHGDWQAALGVTVRVPHLTWVSMEGEAKRDYPASIGYQSPWYKEYNLVEDHFARIAAVMSRGKADVKVAVIHPIESYWMLAGPRDKTMDICNEMDDNFYALCEWLISSQIDFDYISESLLPEQLNKAGVPLKVGEMEYDAVIVSDCLTLRSTTLEALEKFKNAGGKLIFTGKTPYFENAKLSSRGKNLADISEYCVFSKTSIASALNNFREIEIRSGRGNLTDNLIYQMRSEDDFKWLFIAHSKNPQNPDIVPKENIAITVKGEWYPEVYDTVTGNIFSIEFEHKHGNTNISRSIYAHDSLLLKLNPTASVKKPEIINKKMDAKPIVLPDKVSVKLSEPNVLILDMALYSLDDGQTQELEGILRIDKKVRQQLKYPQRDGFLVQPYVLPEEEKEKHFVKLCFKISSDIEVQGAYLAIEHPELSQIVFNGQEVDNTPEGWFVDESIKTVKLPKIYKGDNMLEIKAEITQRIGIEWCYILGDFGVEVQGKRAKIIEPVRELAFGDWSTQGLPFYAGNVTYQVEAETKETLEIEVSHFRNPVIRVDIDGEKKGLIAFAPYRISVPVKPGKHMIELTAYGNRHNAFGAIHNADEHEPWFGPNAWRTEGNAWCYEYRLKPIGIVTTPTIKA